MSDSEKSSNSVDYSTRPLTLNDRASRVSSRRSSVSNHLSRNVSRISEISRIISGIRDDLRIDGQQYESYKYNAESEKCMAEQIISIAGGESETEACNSDRDPQGENDLSDYPIDGKFAFWQAFLVMLMTFSTWGANAAFGVFLNYYLNTDYFPGATKYDFALMGGVVIFLAQALAPICTLAVRIFGQTPIHILGICIQTLGYFLAAECTKLWQIFMCQGVLVGISFSLIFIPGTLVIPTWFDKWKALAMGIAVSGAGLGGLVYSLALNHMIQVTGNQKWALRVAGFVNLAVSLVGTTFMRPRTKKKSSYKTTLKWSFVKSSFNIVFDFKIFDNFPLIAISVWFGIILLGYVIILYSYSSVATSMGLTTTQSSNTLAVLNASSLVGRPLMGNFGDSLGRNNTSIVVSLYVGIMITGFWMNATTYVEFMVLAGIFGGPIGIASLMTQSMAHDILTFRGIPQKIPAAWGGINIVVACFSLPAEVIALKLQTKTGNNLYRHAQIFSACTYFFGVLILLFIREWLIRQKFMSRKRAAETSLRKYRNTYLRTDASLDDHESNDVSSDEDKVNNSNPADTDEERTQRYNQLLQNTPMYFFVRMFYPIRV